MRIEGTVTGDLILSYQDPNLTGDPANDAWTLYRGTGDFPGPDTPYGESVYIGLITYAQGSPSQIPFVGTCDSIELVGESTCDDLSGIAETPAVDYESQIQPIWNAHCISCHGGGDPERPRPHGAVHAE